jgi:serine protease inhibitor
MTRMLPHFTKVMVSQNRLDDNDIEINAQVSTMKQCSEFKYGQTEIGKSDVQFLTIDFDRCEVEMHLVLPRNRYDLSLVENELTAEKLCEMFSSTRKRRIEVLVTRCICYCFRYQCRSSVLNRNTNLVMFSAKWVSMT